MLAFDMRALAQHLLPHGQRQGHEWVHPSLSGGSARSLSVHIGHKAENGVWADFATGEGGDSLDLVAHVLFCGDKKAAFRWALAYLGLGGAPPPIVARPVHVGERYHAAGDDGGYDEKALSLYLSAQPSLSGTPADRYLIARGIDLSKLARQPRSLRFHPACYCGEAGAKLPALLAAVSGPDGHHVATHRTWLAERHGVWVKAELRDPKKTLGRLRGGTIRLRRGGSNKPLHEAPDGETLVVGEGIETCLSVAVACPELRVLCAVSMANAASVELPAQIGPVILLADNDGGNQAARQGLARVVNHFAGTGRMVRIARSPWGKDFNDAIRGAAA
jgi:hypothetical protein